MKEQFDIGIHNALQAHPGTHTSSECDAFKAGADAAYELLQAEISEYREALAHAASIAWYTHQKSRYNEIAELLSKYTKP